MVSHTESPVVTSDRGLVAARTGTTAIATTVTPIDRVRWGPIWAGLFTALSTLALLSVLGLAIGFSSYDANDSIRAFGVGAGWWTAISALIAFFVGGMISARTAAVPGRSEGILQGAMVWIVAIPLLMYMVSAMVGAAARTTGAVADTAAQASVAASNTQAGQQAANQGQQAAGQLQNQAQQTVDQVRQAVTPQRVEQAANRAAGGAWWTLLSMVLGLTAAAVGGVMGARTSAHLAEHHRQHVGVVPAA
ncbi:hypothetical protein [Humisphaera borealis]|uniref:PhnA-like protein n=1 Tax=Humisphaera borealis TaxID=2807512 RepID=A0A7M2X1W2_9BACT|nr:hypothetical protein [Humisphaera borealis]QOV91693.1 hypothetical protein IPV69_10145 [Humisphaera borealis]